MRAVSSGTGGNGCKRSDMGGLGVENYSTPPLAQTLPTSPTVSDCVVPFFDEHDIRLSRMLTDRGTEYCGSPERHEYELYLAIEDIGLLATFGDQAASRNLRSSRS